MWRRGLSSALTPGPSPADAGEGSSAGVGAGAGPLARISGRGWRAAPGEGPGLRFRLLSGSEDPSHRIPIPPRIGLALCGSSPSGTDPCGSGLGRDTAAAVRRLRYRPLSGSEDSSHRIRAPAADRARSLWERPWPRHGRRSLRASIQAAVGVRRPLPQNPGSCGGSGTIPVGAALAATRLLLSAGFDTGRCRGQKTPPTESGLLRRIGHDPCGSGLGRDTAAACRRPRYGPLPRSEAPPHTGLRADGAHCRFAQRSLVDPATASVAPTPGELPCVT
jgi:hypothetical protein